MSDGNNYNGERKKVSIKNLYLDPNNYRFIDNKNYKEVSKEEISSDIIQNRTLHFLVGEKKKGIEDLIKSFKANGFLEVDQIQVESIGDSKYRVLEGNRRVAALKTLYKEYKDFSVDLGYLSPDIFSKVPIVTYEESMSGEHEIIMGLKHISGNKKWPPLNQAKLISDLINVYNWSEDKACESLGISKHELKRSIRTISLINDYRQSDYSDQFQTDMFGIFRETIASQAIKAWFQWDDTLKKPTHSTNTERFYCWLSEIKEIKTDDLGEEITVERGRAITKSTEIATLAKIINDEEALMQFDKSRDVIDAYSMSSSVGEDKYQNSLAKIEQHLEEAQLFARYSKSDTKEKLVNLQNRIESLLVAKGHKEVLLNRSITKKLLVNFRTDHFKELTLNNFKSFYPGLKFKNLNRINIIAGNNNVGKSSVLEAVYLVANQNDINEFIDIYRRRGKFIDALPAKWLSEEFPDKIYISGCFDEKNVEVEAFKQQEPDLSLDKADYLNSIFIRARFNGDTFESKARIFGQKKAEHFFNEIHSICSTSFSSPFTMLSKELINEYHEISIKKGTYERIMDFISEYVDSKIKYITKVGDSEQIRFLVKHDDFKESVDLTQFGEGLQRIFYISLQLAAAQNGIMCIDEIENAIHHSLLVQFTKFIQILAEEYNVQLFITTHSNECINAFFENDYKNEQITGYRLYSSEDGVRYKAAKGKTLQNQIENFNLDLRG